MLGEGGKKPVHTEPSPLVAHFLNTPLPQDWVLENNYSEALDEGGGLFGINAVLILVLWKNRL